MSETATKKPLIIGVTTWIATFLALYLSPLFLPDFDQRLGTFIAALLLTVLSIGVVYGFSCLRLQRQTFLLLGATAAVAVYFLAQPLVLRSRGINAAGEMPTLVLQLSFRAGAGLSCDLPVMPLRNHIFREISSLVDESTPESAALIVFLCLAQLTLAAGIGLWIAEGIEDITHLLPVALIATIADIWSVSAGATAKIVVSSSINYFLLRFPLPATAMIPYLIGLTDFLFFAVFFQAAIRYRLGALRNAILLASAFIIAVISAIYTATGLPVLPFMAVLFVIGNFRRLEWKKEELRQVIVFIVVILVIFAIISYRLQ